MSIVGWVIVCWLVADFLSGLFHWFEDTYCIQGLPIIGRFVCDPNILHHVDPKHMLLSGFVGRNYIQWMLCLVAFVVAWLIGAGTWQVALTLSFLSMANEVHAWNHGDIPKLAELLRDAGILQSKRQHALHHKPPHTRYYCVLGSLVNVVLESMNFWRRAESAVQLVVGVEPRRHHTASRH